MKYIFGFMSGKASWSPPVNQNIVEAYRADLAAALARNWYTHHPSPFGFDDGPTHVVLTDENLKSYVFDYEDKS